jgi:hypothetical protein
MANETGITPFILALIHHPDITRADPLKGAERFGIPIAWAEHYLRTERERRGL